MNLCIDFTEIRTRSRTIGWHLPILTCSLDLYFFCGSDAFPGFAEHAPLCLRLRLFCRGCHSSLARPPCSDGRRQPVLGHPQASLMGPVAAKKTASSHQPTRDDARPKLRLDHPFASLPAAPDSASWARDRPGIRQKQERLQGASHQQSGPLPTFDESVHEPVSPTSGRLHSSASLSEFKPNQEKLNRR